MLYFPIFSFLPLEKIIVHWQQLNYILGGGQKHKIHAHKT